MGFFNNLYQSVKAKQAELKDRKEFLDMVEQKAKPIRRGAYMKQMLKEVVSEGIEKAKTDAASKVKKKNKKPEDFGIMEGLNDPYKFINQTKSKENKK